MADKEQDYRKIVDVIRENPDIGSFELCEKADISFRKVNQFIREGTLVITNTPAGGASQFFVCENCGQGIRSGRLCPRCEGAAASRDVKYVTVLPEGGRSTGYHIYADEKSEPAKISLKKKEAAR
jgi:hypothetical protein